MKYKFTFIIFIISTFSFSQNPYIGTWIAYNIISFNNIDTLSIKQKNDFTSSISFKEDLTYIKITNGQTSIG